MFEVDFIYNIVYCETPTSFAFNSLNNNKKCKDISIKIEKKIIL